jgi:hypothetical protein
MSRALSRVASATLAIIIAAAVGNVAVAHAQTQVQTEGGGVPAISTSCGVGTIEKCGEKSLQTCEYEFALEFDPKFAVFRLVFKQINCRSTGHMPLYKDRYPTTTCTNHGVSRPTGLQGTGDDEEADPVDGEFCQ